MDLEQFRDKLGPWRPVVDKYNNGQQLARYEIRRALNSEVPVPDEAKPILARMLDGKPDYRKPKGSVLNEDDPWSSTARWQAADEVYQIEAMINGGSLRASLPDDLKSVIQKAREDLAKGRRGEYTARDVAKEYVARSNCVSVRQVHNWLKESRQRLSDQLGISVDDAELVMIYLAENHGKVD